MKEIVQEGAAILREEAKPVPEELFGSDELRKLVDQMAESLDQFPEGVALAAPQIGVPYRLFIVRKDRTLEPGALPSDHTPEIEAYANPEIVKTSRKRAKSDEGCLSVHGLYGVTHRHERVTIKARGIDGVHIMRGAGGLMAQIFEHEIDHLNGILFIDHAEHLFKIEHHARKPFLFFGTPSVASDTLGLLIQNGFVPSMVVTSPDAPKGRGLSLTPSPTKVLALLHGIPVITPEKLDDETIEKIARLECAYAVVVAYGKIFPEKLISAFPLGVLNVHYSLLPKYRGATPLEGALLAGETKTGVTIQKMVKQLDAGDILAQNEVDIEPSDTAKELRPRLIQEGAELLIETLERFEHGEITLIAQDPLLATHTHKMKKEDGLLDVHADGETNWNKYRAYADTIGTYFMENGTRMKITAATYTKGRFVVERVIPEGRKEIAYTPR